MKSRVRMGFPCTLSITLFGFIALGSILLATPPEPPANLIRSNYVDNPRSITLGWQDNSNTETSFFVEWTLNGGATWTTFGQVGANITSCSASLPIDQTLYLFRAFASDGTESSDFSNIVSVEGTDPAVADTDGDGINDGYELTHGMNPYVADSYEDSDGDRYPNIIEYAKGTNPNEATSIPTADFVVDPAGPAQGNVYTTIQAALDAVSADYQIVKIKKGLFQGTGNTNLVLPSAHPILLMSEAGARETILDGGGVARGVTLSTSSVIDGLTIRNTVATYGAAVYVSGGSPLFVNSVFVGNQAQESGGAVYQEAGNSLLVHTTLRNNQATIGGSGLYVESGTLSADKSILWDTGSVSEIEVAVGATCEVTESIVRGGYSGTGNSSNDPLLRADGHLMAGSPAIDSGGTLQTALRDMDGEVRPSGSTTDVGADEWVDSDTNSLPDWWEVLQFGQLGNLSSSDADGDGLSNLQEYQEGSDPLNYYSQGSVMISPTITIVSGNDQMGVFDCFAPLPLVVEVKNGSNILVNAPVAFTVLGTGTGQISNVGTGTGLASSVQVTTDASGHAQVFFLFPSTGGVSSSIRAVAEGISQVNFQVSSTKLPLSGLKMWLSADKGITKDGSNKVSVWSDQSGNGNAATQSTGTSMPTWVDSALNGKPILRFNGSSTYMGCGSGLNNSSSLPLTFMVVTRGATNPLGLFDSAPMQANVFRFNPTNAVEFWNQSPSVALTLPSGGAIATVIGAKSASNNRLLSVFLNGVQQGATGTGDTSGVVFLNPQIGRVNTSGIYYNGDIAEVVYYNRSLSDTERRGAEAYLFAKYRVGNQPITVDPSFDNQRPLFSNDRTVTITASEGAAIYYTTDGTEPTTASSIYTNPITISATTTVKAFAKIPGFVASATRSATYTKDPNTASVPQDGLMMWLRSDMGIEIGGSSLITKWNDLSGNGMHASQVTATIGPSLQTNVLNGNPVVRFNGSTQYLNLSTALNNANALPLTVVMVTRGAANPRGVFDSAPLQANVFRCLNNKVEFWNQSPTVNVTWPSSGVVAVIEGTKAGNGNRQLGVRVNGAPQDGGIKTGNSSPVVILNGQLGRYNNPSISDYFYYNGDIAEVLLFNRKLTESELGNIEAYLLARYAITLNPDSDSDGLPDSWEMLKFGNLSNTSTGDPDGDGINNLGEYIAGTHPNNADTDGDNLPDGYEIAHGLNPISNDSAEDPDFDGLSNFNEFTATTDPRNADTDADGMPDGYELTNGLNALSNDSQLDRDGDGIPNQWEYVNGSSAGVKASMNPNWVVDPAHGADSTTDNIVSTITEAITAVPVDNGNVAASYKSIYLKNGEYAESVTIPTNKRIALTGERGGKVILVGSSVSSTVLSFGARSVVDGLVITRTKAAIQAGTVTGSGVYVNGSTANGIGRILNCMVYGHAKGIEFADNPTGSPSVEYCSVFRNTIAGMYAPYRDRITTIKNCIIWNTLAGAINQFGSPNGQVPNVAGNIVYAGQFGGINSDPKLSADGLIGYGSGAKDIASGGTAIFGDIHGEIRPNGATGDMGADEWVDSDSDGLNDQWEMMWFGDLVQDGTGDFDGDGLNNGVEALAGTDPGLADTDGDGASDAVEISGNTDPLSADTDGDGMSDGYELANELNPLLDDSLLDKDGDRVPNLWEFCKGAAAGDKYNVPAWDYVVDPAHANDSGTDNIVGTVGAAISAAPALGVSGVGYSTIYVKGGEYPEYVDLVSNKAIALIAEVGTTPVRLLGNNYFGYSVLNFSGKAVVDGFKITRPEAVILAGTSLGPGVGVNTGTLKSRLANCMVTGSTWNYTGGLYAVGGNILVENCTVFGNATTGSIGSGMYLTGSPKIEIKSSIFWDSQSSGAAEVYKASSATLTIISSIVRGAQYGGLNVEPRLRKDGKLLGDSPAINTGDPNSTLKTDIEGEERPGGGIVDMGVDEYVDVDSDGLSDLWEMRYFGNLNEVANGDTDGDGLLNSFEYLFSLNPALGDTDGNARDDFYDALSALATLHYPEDWLADADSDGLTNGWEEYFGTDRNNPDTNFDGISDSVSVSVGIDALNLDHDGDGCSNMVEISAGTNLFYSDTDRDGVDDLADAYPLDPLRSTALSSDPQDTIPPDIALTEPDFAILLP